MTKLLANENIPLRTVKYLQKKGFDIKSIGLECASITDQEVMQIAIDKERLIITFDRDYGELIFRLGYKPKAGVIYLRLPEIEGIALGEYLKQLFDDDTNDFTNKFTVIDEKSIRQRIY